MATLATLWQPRINTKSYLCNQRKQKEKTMAAKKENQSGKVYLISKDDTDNPKLVAKILADGRESLYLDYYLGYRMVYDEAKDKEIARKERKRETLKLYLWQAPRTPAERQQNKETLELAKKIRFEREQELKEGTLGYRLKAKEINFIDFMQSFWENATKDKRMIKGAMCRFIDFLKEEYPLYATSITPRQIDKDMIEKFVEYLKSRGKGEGAHSYFCRFKKIIKNAEEKGLFKENPCKKVVFKADKNALKKEILTIEEMERLINTTYPEQNQETRRAFIFTLYTGIRFCDVKRLTFSNVDYSEKLLSFNQNKTDGSSEKSWVYIPLSDGLISLIGTGEPDEKIFKLPSQMMCLKALRHWTAKAGITKHITWHCGRHSFAVNILNNGANIKTVASLLGHSSIAMTEKYTRAVDRLKKEAINSLPELKL